MRKGSLLTISSTLMIWVLLIGSYTFPQAYGLEFSEALTCKYPYSYVWVYCSQSLFKASPFERTAFINALEQAVEWWRQYPKNMPSCLSYQLSDMFFEDGEDFVIWWQSQPVSRDMVIYIVDDYLQASLTDCINAIGNSEGSIFMGDASIWIATQHIRCVYGRPSYQSWIPYSEFHDILKALLGEGVGHSGTCPLGDLLGPFWECIFESIDDAENHPDNMCVFCWRWYVTNALPRFY